MVKKLRAMAASSASDSELAAAVKESAQQIWQAGLGAFAKAQTEGQKLFSALAKEGSVLEARTLRAAEQKVGEVSGRLSSVAGEFQKQATGAWDKLEAVFEQRVERALDRLGMPSSKEIAQLTKKVEHLTAAVNALSGTKPASGQAGTKKAIKKAAVKKSAPTKRAKKAS